MKEEDEYHLVNHQATAGAHRLFINEGNHHLDRRPSTASAPRPSVSKGSHHLDSRSSTTKRSRMSIKEEDNHPFGRRLSTADSSRLSVAEGSHRLDSHPSTISVTTSATTKRPRMSIKEEDEHPFGMRSSTTWPPRLSENLKAPRSSESPDSSSDEDDAVYVQRRRAALGPRNESGTHVQFSGKPLTLLSIGDQTASTLAVVKHATHPGVFQFSCPVRSCSATFDDDCTYGEFAEHVFLHGVELFNMGLNPCPFGCRLGFVDPLQQRQHVVFDCNSAPGAPFPDPYTVKAQVCSHPGCRSKYGTDTQMRQHYMKKHGSKVYKDDPSAPNQDHVCFKGFATSYSLYLHLIAKAGTGSHVSNILAGFNVTAITYTP